MAILCPSSIFHPQLHAGVDREFSAMLCAMNCQLACYGDKITGSGVTPVASHKVGSPGFAEAELVLECRKLFWQDIDNRYFVDTSIEKHYPEKDYHRMFFGEVVGMFGK